MIINEVPEEIHSNAKSKGFYNGKFNMGERIALIHSELSEALEADRSLNYCLDSCASELDRRKTGDEWNKQFEASVKDRFEDELADAMIRIMDLAKFKGIDLEWHIRMKMKYNSTRELMHGKKY